MFGPIDKKDMIKFGIVERPIKNAEYIKLSSTPQQTIGVSHHKTGLGKLKVLDKESNTEYGVSISDILNKPLSEWKIEKK